MQEEGAEPALPVHLVGRRLDLRQLERILLLPAVRDGVRLLIDGHGKQLVLPIKHRPINQQKGRYIEGQPDAVIPGNLKQIKEKKYDPEHNGRNRGPQDEPGTAGIGIDGFHIDASIWFSACKILILGNNAKRKGVFRA